MFDLSTPIEQLYLVGPARAKLLKKLGILTLYDLLFYFPRKHQDLSVITDINKVKLDEHANVKARVLEVKSFRTRVRHMTITHVLIEDNSGSLMCVWYNQPYLIKALKEESEFIFSGKVTLDKNKPTLQNPIYEIVKPEQVHTARLVPVYSLTANLTQKQLRSIIKTYLDKTLIPEYLPETILKSEKLLSLNQAIKQFHFPDSFSSLKTAQNRLSFDEIFQTQVRVMQTKKQRQAKTSFRIESNHNLPDKIKSLPFSLTQGQIKVLDQIVSDLELSYPANRLLEGDVGSGKTVVAALAMWLAAKNEFQSAMLAPTEVLARQHYENLKNFFENDGLSAALITSNHKVKPGQITFGTHALLQKSVEFKNLGLVVIDEQHRFGVEQRSILKNLHNAHLLSMSATPIPRTLALTLYGDLDISVISELPKDRVRIKTALVPEAKRIKAYKFIHDEIRKGRQAFVICPRVDDNQTKDIKSATAEYEKLTGKIYPDLNIGLLHGKLKPKEKEQVMQKFTDNEINILVSTSVVEVGVDVPNATVMMIEGAERFGLAQLHQFRGRVGRSTHQSYCFLFSDDPSAPLNPRLIALTKSANGFELAEQDLQIRGSGDLYGTTQSGYGFKIATLSDFAMVERSKEHAKKLLDLDPALNNYPLIRGKIAKQALVHLE
jgi:ATP-dependent DNA helicase RecG